MKNAQDLLRDCKQYVPHKIAKDGSLSDFALIVQNGLAIMAAYQRDLADDLEVAESTVSRWATGVAKPHPIVQKRVVAWMQRRLTKMVERSALVPAHASGG